jgi:hypothetical protein
MGWLTRLSGLTEHLKLAVLMEIGRHERLMGWLTRHAGLTEHLKLDVLMEFDTRSGQGFSALRWIVTRPHASLSDEQSRIALVALLYARTWSIIKRSVASSSTAWHRRRCECWKVTAT